MNPVPPLTTILMEFLFSGGANQTNSLAHSRALQGTDSTRQEFCPHYS
jgi:hypothetical protein